MFLFKWLKKQVWDSKVMPLFSPAAPQDNQSVSLFIQKNQFLQPQIFQPYGQDEFVQILQNQLLEKCDEKRVLATLVKGIPYYSRKILWDLLSMQKFLVDQYQSYQQLKKTSSQYQSMIRKDINRTFSDCQFFLKKENVEKLFRILKSYSNLDTQIGYVQGLNFIAGAVLRLYDLTNDKFLKKFNIIQESSQQTCFWIFVCLMKVKDARLNFMPGLKGLMSSVERLHKKIQIFLPDLAKHIANNNFNMMIFFMHCYTSLCLVDVSVSLAQRFLDLILYKEIEIIDKFILKGLRICQKRLLKINQQGQFSNFIRRKLWKCAQKGMIDPKQIEDLLE